MSFKEKRARFTRTHNRLIVFWFPWYWRRSDTADFRRLVSRHEWAKATRASEKAYLLLRAILWPLFAATIIVVCLKKYAPQARAISQRPIRKQVWEQVLFTFWFGYAPHEYYERSLYLYDFSDVVVDFLAQYECRAAAIALNGSGAEVIKNKRLFYEQCVRGRLPVVPPIGYLGETSEGFAADELPHVDLFLKPEYGKKGIGIERWDFDEDSVSWSFKGASKSAAELSAYLQELSKRGVYVVQQAVCNHPDVAAFSLRGVVTFRVITVSDGASPPEVIAAYLAAPRGRAITNHEVVGGMMAEMDIGNGRLSAAYSDTPKVERHRTHPDTGAQIEGVAVPGWEHILKTAVSMHREFEDVFSIGWDIVYTPDGCRALEGNTFWGLSPGLYLGRTCYVPKALNLWHRRITAAAR